MSVQGFDLERAAGRVHKGFVELGFSIERAAQSFVEMQREKTETGQELAKEMTAAIEALVEELRKP